MKTVSKNLTEQLIALAGIVCGIIFISLGLLLPKVLLPIYEKKIYQYLEQPLSLVKTDIKALEFASDVAYIYITRDNEVLISSNLYTVINIDTNQILSNITYEYGKFKYFSKTYYYSKMETNVGTKISITDDKYIQTMKKDILYSIIPILMITFLIIVALFIIWSRRLVKKIEHLKEKVDNLDNDDYVDNYEPHVDDELNALSKAIDDMKLTLQQNDEYKNQIYQNISHDFKTPLTVIKSYIEAIEDGVETLEGGSTVIKEQLKKLEIKVHSLLYLNKLNYIKDTKDYKKEKCDVISVLNIAITKFKIVRPDVNFEIFIQTNNHSFKGTCDMWEAIIDNMLSNFTRYADKSIKITFKNNRIIFYNDGPNIDPNILECIFTPYKKGIKGQFGLGLSIIKKTLSLFGYEITVQNEKKGISFIIK